MKYTMRLLILVLCAALCMGGCGLREKNPAAPDATAAPESAVTPEATAAAGTESAAPADTTAAPFDQAAYDDAVTDILDQYLELREKGIDGFDEEAHPQLPWYSAVVASWSWNALYYGTWDFDGNGVDELIVAAGDDDFCQPVGIYAFDGRDMRYLCPDQALGERSSVSRMRLSLMS